MKYNMTNGSYMPNSNYHLFKHVKHSGYYPTLRRCWSAVARLLGWRFRILSGGGCLSLVSVVCYQVEVSARADPSSREVLPSVCVCVCVCDNMQPKHSTPTVRR